MSRSSRLILGALVAAAVAAASALTAAASWLNRPTGVGEQMVRIDKGMNARQIGDLLEERGLVRSAWVFSWNARLRGLGRQLEAGRYSLSGAMSSSEILDGLRKAPLEMDRVTVPEGLTLSETAALLQKRGFADSARFVTLATNLETVRRHGVEAASLEGYLFPETYFFDKGVSEKEIIDRMVSEFFTLVDAPWMARLDSLEMSLHEAVTLASIIEGEARLDSERTIISSIFHRRLKLRRRLESCATVEYALGFHKERLNNEDLQVKSPFNTYLHQGLPPGPIGNPGRTSLRATLYPADTDYLYFVARGGGTHSFSRTHREHQAVKRAIRREKRQRRKPGIAAAMAP